jgi:hypothetical protein
MPIITDIWWWPHLLSRLWFDNDLAAWPTRFFLCVFWIFSIFRFQCQWCFHLLFFFYWVSFFSTTNTSLFASYFKIGNSICHPLEHWHFLATSFMRLLSMHIVLHGLSPTNMMFSVVHMFYSCDSLIWLTIDCRQELVASCSWNPDWTFVSLWHRLCILAHDFPISHFNTIVCIDHFHLFLIHC